MFVFSLISLLLLVGAILLIPAGLRAGDRSGDALLLNVQPQLAPRGATVTVNNPEDAAVLVGVSLRRARPRLRLEGGSYVKIRTGRTTSDLRADQQTQIAVLAAGETQTVVVRADARVRRRAELVVVVGQSQRLRSIHRLVVLPRSGGDQASHQIGVAGLQPLER
ncbi:MAG TPA: hypothetical protein VMF57_08410 [Solirubrobacteraceae bacterium]|nr:hypothetical protein [Solirubrobacteraceae bacterium]